MKNSLSLSCRIFFHEFDVGLNHFFDQLFEGDFRFPMKFFFGFFRISDQKILWKLKKKTIGKLNRKRKKKTIFSRWKTDDFSWTKIFRINSNSNDSCFLFFSNFIDAFALPTEKQRKRSFFVSKRNKSEGDRHYMIFFPISWNAASTNSRTLWVSPWTENTKESQRKWK